MLDIEYKYLKYKKKYFKLLKNIEGGTNIIKQKSTNPPSITKHLSSSTQVPLMLNPGSFGLASSYIISNKTLLKPQSNITSENTSPKILENPESQTKLNTENCGHGRLYQISGTGWFNSSFNALILSSRIKELLLNNLKIIKDTYYYKQKLEEIT